MKSRRIVTQVGLVPIALALLGPASVKSQDRAPSQPAAAPESANAPQPGNPPPPGNAAQPGSAPQPANAPQAANAPAGDSFDGKQLFATSCGWCHQQGGRAAGRGPKLAGTEQSDEYLINRIKTGKQGAMPAFGSTFTEPQLKAIVAYIRGLKDSAQ
jgi:mono/diheme cytochrome c family protein